MLAGIWPAAILQNTHSVMAPVSFSLRLVRFARLALHFAQGLLTLAFRFDRYSSEQRISSIQRWSVDFLHIVGVSVEHTGELPPAGLLVMNHISWLDVIVVNALAPSRFVSKAEVARWPLVGYLVSKSGTLYIERSRKTAARKTNGSIARALADGERVAVFPEGTTTSGESLLHFHAALLQPVITSAGRAYPAALRYLDASGERSLAVSYVGDETLVGSVWQLLGANEVVARIEFGLAEPAAGRHRRELANALHATISQQLQLGNPHMEPGRRGHPPAALR
jgi:1-acyl-sn-glycerol-3-phosphate acyltransferase